MASNQFSLMRDKRFLPLFITQFFGAFHDNVYKNALVVLLLYGVSLNAGAHDTELLVTAAAGLFILPFILFSALGGQLADKYPKNKVIRVIKVAEIAIALLGVASLFTGSLILSFAALFALGAQSAFFGPSKYAILPDHLKDNELIAGNALINTGTFLAILFGTIIGTVLITLDAGLWIISGFLIVSAVLGYIASRSIPDTPAKASNLKLNFNPITETITILRFAFSQQRGVVQSILGVGWFYFLAGMFMAQFPNFTKITLGADETVLAVFLVTFSVGIAIGGLLNNSLLKGRVEATYVPIAAIMMSIFCIDLSFAGAAFDGEELVGITAFFSEWANIRIAFDVFMIALFGGLYVVPLNAIIQHNTDAKQRARIIAGSSILDAIFIFSSAALSAFLITKGWSIRDLFLTFAVLNTLVALYICTILPADLFKSFLQAVFKLLYKVEVKGLENFEKAGDRAVIVSNHVALLDPPLLAAFLPGKPMFAVNSFVAEWPILKALKKIVNLFPLDPTNPFSIKSLIKEVEKDKHCVIFPEGRLTETGALMKVYEGPGMVADKADAMILPVRLDGVQHTPFARLKGKVPLKSFPKITITILPPRKFKIDDELKGRQRRAAAGRQLYQLMEEMMFMTTDREQTLFNALLKARHVNGDKSVIVEDAEFKPMKFKQLLRGSMVLGRKISGFTDKAENVGVLLPNSVGAVVTFFALQAFGRVPAMLNFSAGAQALTSACQTAKVNTVLTSRRFIEMGRLEDVLEEIAQHAKIIYLEDIKERVTFGDKMFGLFSNPARVHKKQGLTPNDPALVLFTSGSEGMPKGVVLSHANVMSNIVQLSSRVDFNRQDIVFNCLPMFHSFGLTGGTLLPILSGVKTFLYPSPLHYRIVPELIYSTNATIMFGTDTFLNGYARMAHPYDFYRMRYIFAGAEKVKDETRQLYMNKYGVRILEGYGATETAPALALNSPMHLKAGSVGRLLSGIEYKLEDVPGVDVGGRLYVRGPNIMLGYYRADSPGVLEPPVQGWYDTGDIVDIDDQGYVSILGRAKRFAKIAGEMVSLTSVESMIQKIYPDAQNAVVAISDARKGEQLIFVTTQKDADRKALSSYASEHGVSELAVPRTILHIEKMPVLGSGKTDYTNLQNFVNEQLVKAA
ncbi:MAG: acyl-[ACP]--phospholipid O-acyltransferase [Micavibrio sp. TMED27]|nr:acyl-[ACP]--phospholipid O-acyltransferase [Micavibrio sp.]OUT92442.1 MAG: acyl-[ACP]--phospholipid O-acyltransferase [Micavibrio sp. TMED27]